MYTLKSIVRRCMLFGATAALVGAAVVPAAAVFADALNPLTERSLLLSSSAPGYQDTDGAGNSETNPNSWNGGENYAPPGSGPNGKKTGETFSFKVSTDSDKDNRPIKAFTLQYCTTAAGVCQAPGNNQGDARSGSVTPRESNEDAWPENRSDLNVNYTSPVAGTDFKILLKGADVSTGWTMTTANKEDTAHSGDLTGKNNYVTLTHASGISPEFNDQIQIIFLASSTNYITNPGEGHFFVKMNTFDSATTSDHIYGGEHNIDGGVTVANVMTDSIHIVTKVLETMAFSVGTQNPDTQAVQHGSCDAMQVVNGNRLNLGNPDGEYSLETTRAWDVYSYWRLSSNSSGGATVYYSGDTLRNTVGDHIADMPVKAHSQPGTEQFGLALVNPVLVEDTNHDPVNVGDAMDGGTFPPNWFTPKTLPLIIEDPYKDGDTPSISSATTGDNAQFTFLKSSQMVPEIVAQENTEVISCATSKVRYVGNIAADTPAGVYTTKINFLAAPQY